MWWIILAIYIVSVALIINYLVIYEYAMKKGYEGNKYRFEAIIPWYGYIKIKKLPNLKPLADESVMIKELLHHEFLVKKIIAVMLVVLGIFIILIPISLIVYAAFKNNLMQTLLTIYLVVLVWLVHQGLVVDYAHKKGYEGIKTGLLGLVPVYGFIYYVKAPKRRNTNQAIMKKVFSFSNIISRVLIYGQISLLAIIVIVPVIYIFGMAFSNLRSDIPNQIWPDKPSFDAFIYLFRETKFNKWYGNTLLIAVINMIVGTVLITGASYVFARFKFKGKKAGLLTILVLQAFPSFMGLIAMYVLFWKFGLLGQPLALTILYIGGGIPGNLWLIKGFLDQIPKDLDESAMIDGASKLRIFTSIILPLAVPILTFVAVSMFMSPWMDYMLPGYLLNFMPAGAPADYDVQNQWTLAVGIFNFINDINSINYSAFAAAALIVGIPIAVLYMVFQKYLIEGIMAGATKG